MKGRAGAGDVELSENEWARARSLRAGYWLYAVYDCATPGRDWCASATRSGSRS